jgi:hypothetical protein
MDTFFLITLVSDTEESTHSFGPYRSFLEANAIALDCTSLLINLSGISSIERCLIQVLECIYTNSSIEVINVRGNINMNGYPET